MFRLRTLSKFRPMSSHAYLDASPPLYNGPREQLDKAVFHKTLKVLAARVPPNKTGQFLKAQPLKGYVVWHQNHTGFLIMQERILMNLPKVRSVSSDPENPNGDRLVLLRISHTGGSFYETFQAQELIFCKIVDISPEAKEYIDKEAHGLTDFRIDLDYDYWTAGESA